MPIYAKRFGEGTPSLQEELDFLEEQYPHLPWYVEPDASYDNETHILVLTRATVEEGTILCLRNFERIRVLFNPLAASSSNDLKSHVQAARQQMTLPLKNAMWEDNSVRGLSMGSRFKAKKK